MINGDIKLTELSEISEAEMKVCVYEGDLAHLRAGVRPAEKREGMTLNDLINGEDILTVFVEGPISGRIYQYGVRGKYWDEIGTLVGYA